MFSVINGLSAVNEPELIIGVQLSSVVPGHMLKYILTITLKKTKMHTMLKKQQQCSRQKGMSVISTLQTDFV